MRYFIAALMICSTFVYADEPSETPAEITNAEEGDSDEVAANVDSLRDFGGCGCGGGKKGDGKPKV